jgi:hypothetical protein
MSKMGISTYQSYCGAQIFDAVGLSSDFVNTYFTGTATMIEGVGLDEVASETAERHRLAFSNDPVLATRWKWAANMPTACAAKITCMDARCGGHAAARRARQCAGALPGIRRDGQRSTLRMNAIRGLFASRRCGSCRPQAGAAGRGRARRGYRQAVFDRRHVVRLDQPRSAYDAGDRDEPDRRQVEHRRRRRGAGPLPAAARRRSQSGALGDQAGRLGPVRRDDGIPGQRRHDPDQGRAGRKARRGRAVARPQGGCDDRQDGTRRRASA